MEDLKVSLLIKADASSPEAYQIRVLDVRRLEITGTDLNGAMYGGLEVADRIRLGLPLEDQDGAPFVKKRGIKFNIPFDARTPSYDDTGDAAQINTETVWDLEFWKAYLDDLARYRYNVLSLWSTHPYPSIIQLEDYLDVALDDVYRVSEGIFQPKFKNRLQDVDLDEPGVMELVKKISMEDKISHWQQVFQYAEDRGIEIYLFHWNVMTFGATGKYGITPDQSNPVSIDYMRKCISQALRTYPNIKGIGVTAGENADNNIEGEYSIENYLFNTYGRGIMDVLEEQPEREVRFIFRRHMSGLAPITEAFADFPDEFNTSFKYAIGHMYSMRKPELFDHDFRAEVEEFKVPCWLNLRNDDMFVLRWGSPDFVRDYIQKMPLDVMPGFYMGSDGYVWGREFIAKNPELTGRLEIDKHWYRFRQWGQLAYNPELGRDYWEASLRQRFPGIDAGLLYQAWAAVSEIVPQVNSATYCPNDAHFSPEGCIAREGFLTVDNFYFSFWPMLGSGILSVEEWGQAIVAGKTLEGITPLQVADKLDQYAATALAALPRLGTQVSDNAELQETLNDIEAMAYLGRYYADKMRGAAKLAAFRISLQKQFSEDAVGHFKDALKEWKAYEAIVSSQYKPQLMARTNFMDWSLILPEVEKEVVSAEQEGDFPEVSFLNLKDGTHLHAESDLQVEVDAHDKDGIHEVKLYLNGMLLKPKAGEAPLWDASSDELLDALKPGVYRLKAVAEDKTGTLGWQEVQIYVGDVEEGGDWSEKIHQVILNEGEVFMGGDVLEFPRLECYLTLRDDGRLALFNGTPGQRGRMIWKAMMHSDEGDSHYTTLEKGQLATYRGTPGNQEAKPWQTPLVSGQGAFKFGISISKRLVIFREVEGDKNQIVWKSEVLEPWRL
ncbi:MAG: hypothetical protein QNK35_16225 [Bacteroides sp.]|nr:hypothetical protein [Bacteroides sp.]